MRSACLYLLLAVSTGAAAQPAQIPPRSTGNINGMRALLFAPGSETAKGTSQIESVAGCVVHAVPDASRDNEHTFPCGTWFLLPKPGIYRVWLEQPGRLSPQISLHYAAERFNGSGFVSIHPMKPAGAVLVRGGGEAGAEGIRLLSLEQSWPRAFERRVPRKSAGTPVPMPAGRVLAGWFDAKGNAVALSRPVEVEAGKTIEIVPRPPASGSDVLVVLTRPVAAGRCKPQLAAQSAKLNRPPDVLAAAAERIFAVWYGLPAGRIDLAATCDDLRWEPASVAGANGKVITSRGTLVKETVAREGGAE